MTYKLKSVKTWTCFAAVVAITIMAFVMPVQYYSTWVSAVKWIVGILVVGNVASKRYKPERGGDV